MATPAHRTAPSSSYFVTTKCWEGRAAFQVTEVAEILLSSIFHYRDSGAYLLHEFVIMPDHLHALITVHQAMTIEKAMQLIKGRFSHRLKLETGYLGEIWQRGFSEVQVMNSESLLKHRDYIAQNPVKAGLVNSPEQYPFCFRSLAKKKAVRADTISMAGAEAHIS